VGSARLLIGFHLLLVALAGSPAHAVEPPHGFPAVFDSREVFSANIKLFPSWTDVLQRARAEIARADAPCSGAASSGCQPDEWQSILRHLTGLSPRAKTEYVNARVNAHPYVASLRNWHAASYWETPFEFFRRNGQCQDYATTKFMLLRAAGIPNDAMRLVVVHDFVSKQDHALLLVDVDGEALMLDNQTRDIVPAAQVHRYQPYYSINETGWWRHLPQTPAAIAALRPAAAPGADG
jgi:predicted transglutaminase-like cysteine proteinase